MEKTPKALTQEWPNEKQDITRQTPLRWMEAFDEIARVEAAAAERFSEPDAGAPGARRAPSASGGLSAKVTGARARGRADPRQGRGRRSLGPGEPTP